MNDVIKSLCKSLTGSRGFTLAKYVVQQEDRLDDATSIFARCMPLSHIMSRSRCIVVPDPHSAQLRACNAMFYNTKTKVRGYDSMDPCHRDANAFQNAIDNTWPLKMQVQKAVLLGTVRHGPWLGGAFGQQLRELWNLLIQSIAINSTSSVVVQNMRAGIAFDRRLRLDDMPENILEMIPSNPFKLAGQYVTSSNSHSTCM